jgi:hypothetical protein
MTLRQLRYHDNSGTTWLCDGTWRTQVVTSGGISQANQINALLQDPETSDKRTVGPPASVFLIQALKNADACCSGSAGAFAITMAGYDDVVAEKIWNSPPDDSLWAAPPFSEDNVAPDDDCAWAAA